MGTSAQWVFEKAMYLIDEQDPASGKADVAPNRAYKDRALHILNLMRQELAASSDTFAPGRGRGAVREIGGFEEDIDLDEGVAQGAMPYGLAAALTIEENPAAAGFFQQRYEALKRQFQRELPAASQEIADLYGGLEI